ncbi:SDR family oxidoreductase [Proteus vulgaris]|uniref:SDR family NAD(P)-dependent oxidoreductase n=1 Tax=Proteus vulgaris TaxID=585 RepID=UPI0018E48AE3|nr:SDR family NAD(P)-dependent oxidoreductase [Proteus vulgaris]MBI6529247.1 SDR family oxidoreductase [Proteus vulgaris]
MFSEKKVMFITGAGAGIGEAIALHQAQQGYAVVISDLHIELAEKVKNKAMALGAQDVLALQCDISQEQSVIEAFDQSISYFNAVPTGIVANAGIEITKMAHETSLAEWEHVIKTNLTGTFLTCREAIKQLINNNIAGSLVCISSPSASVGFAGGANSAYGASKGGISALVKALAIDYASHHIRVNAVVPGATDTELLKVTTNNAEHASLEQRIKTQIPAQRLAKPEEIAHAVDWLLSTHSSYITGSHLYVDGGLTARGANDF